MNVKLAIQNDWRTSEYVHCQFQSHDTVLYKRRFRNDTSTLIVLWILHGVAKLRGWWVETLDYTMNGHPSRLAMTENETFL